MSRRYVCRRCGRTYSLQEYGEDRFCRSCGTYLMISKRSKEVLAPADATIAEGSERGWLPEGYEVRKGQLEFLEEASKAIENHRVFLGSAPCGVGKSLASLLAVLPRLQKGKLLVCFRTRSQLHIYLKELRAIGRGLSAASFISKRDMCPRMKTDVPYFDFLEECRRLRENCSTNTRPYCEYYMKNSRRAMEAEKMALDCARKILPPLEVVKRMAGQGFCAYEAVKGVLGKVNVFLGTYGRSYDLGYKLHVSVDHRRILPLASVLAPANENEKKHGPTLVERTREVLRKAGARLIPMLRAVLSMLSISLVGKRVLIRL